MAYTDEIDNIMSKCNNDVIAVICRRIKSIGGLSAGDAQKLAVMSRTKDLKEIEKIISASTGQAISEIEKIIEKASKENNLLAEAYYLSKGMNNTTNSATLNAIMNNSKKKMSEDVLNLSKTTGFMIDKKPTKLTKAYTDVINQSLYAASQGLTDYNTAIRSAVRKIADSGLRTIDFESGYSRRLDSQIRMNVLDGMRQFNNEYRLQQGEEFGADGVEIDAHALCAEDHLPYQGQRFTTDGFERLQNRLERPIGEMNCQHSIFPIIISVDRPTYKPSELYEMEMNSTKMVSYKGIDGKVRSCTRYQASQVQRQQETKIRRLKDRKQAYLEQGDELMAKATQKKITEQSRYYRQLSADVGLKPKPKRLTIAKPK